MSRPQLRPGLRRLWRDQSTLQLGLSPQHGTVLTGLRGGDDVVLSALDGTHDLEQVHAVARARAVPRSRVDELVRVLGEAGVLLGGPEAGGWPEDPLDRAHLSHLGYSARRRLAPDADSWALTYPGGGDGVPVLARRARQQVLVDGAGRLGAAVAVTLAAAGVGTVATTDTSPVREQDLLPAGYDGDDVGSSRDGALGRAVARARGAPLDAAQPAVVDRPDLVVVVRDDVVEVTLGDHLVKRGLPHLAVVAGADRVVVGPLVLPGRGPCLRCLHLHRRDRDAAWPHLAAQLVAGRASATARGETASATAAAGLAALQVLTFLDGRARPVTMGRTLDLVLPDGMLESRRWRAHPSCGCTRLPATEQLPAAEHEPAAGAGARTGAAERTQWR